MKLLNCFYAHKRLVSLALWFIFVLTVALNMVFNLELLAPGEDTASLDKMFEFSYYNQEEDSIQSIDVFSTGETIVQKLYIYNQFNEMEISHKCNDADNKAKLYIELFDPNGEEIWSKKGKANDVLEGFYTYNKYFNSDGKCNGIYTLKITPINGGKPGSVLIYTCRAPKDAWGAEGSELKIGDKVISERALDMYVMDHYAIRVFGFYNVFFALLPLFELALIIAWQIIKHKMKKRAKPLKQ